MAGGAGGLLSSTTTMLTSLSGSWRSWGREMKAILSQAFGDVSQSFLSAAASGIGTVGGGPLGILFGLGGVFGLLSGLLSGGASGHGGGSGRSDVSDTLASVRAQIAPGSREVTVQVHTGAVFGMDDSRRALGRLGAQGRRLGEIYR